MDKSTCVTCGALFSEIHGSRGRPRKKCFECSPRKESHPAAARYINCEQCGVETEARATGRKFCSEACKYQARVSRSSVKCSICGEPMYVGRTTKKENPAHNACRRSVGGGHGATGYDKGCRCQVCKDGMAKRMREYTARYKAKHGYTPSKRWRRERRGVPVEDQICVKCGDPLGASYFREDVEPMHRECRAKLPSWLIKGQTGPKQRAARRRLDRAARGRPSTKRTFTQGACSWCGKQFMSSGGSFFCSYACRKRHRHHDSNAVSFSISPIDRQSIYERDGWMCQLCERPVDPALNHPNLWAASLDHVIPQSAMIIPDHSPENLRLSHFLCNSYRRETELDADKLRTLTEDRWEAALAA